MRGIKGSRVFAPELFAHVCVYAMFVGSPSDSSSAALDNGDEFSWSALTAELQTYGGVGAGEVYTYVESRCSSPIIPYGISAEKLREIMAKVGPPCAFSGGTDLNCFQEFLLNLRTHVYKYPVFYGRGPPPNTEVKQIYLDGLYELYEALAYSKPHKISRAVYKSQPMLYFVAAEIFCHILRLTEIFKYYTLGKSQPLLYDILLNPRRKINYRLNSLAPHSAVSLHMSNYNRLGEQISQFIATGTVDGCPNPICVAALTLAGLKNGFVKLPANYSRPLQLPRPKDGATHSLCNLIKSFEEDWAAECANTRTATPISDFAASCTAVTSTDWEAWSIYTEEEQIYLDDPKSWQPPNCYKSLNGLNRILARAELTSRPSDLMSTPTFRVQYLESVFKYLHAVNSLCHQIVYNENLVSRDQDEAHTIVTECVTLFMQWSCVWNRYRNRLQSAVPMFHSRTLHVLRSVRHTLEQVPPPFSLPHRLWYQPAQVELAIKELDHRQQSNANFLSTLLILKCVELGLYELHTDRRQLTPFATYQGEFFRDLDRRWLKQWSRCNRTNSRGRQTSVSHTAANSREGSVQEALMPPSSVIPNNTHGSHSQKNSLLLNAEPPTLDSSDQKHEIDRSIIRGEQVGRINGDSQRTVSPIPGQVNPLPQAIPHDAFPIGGELLGSDLFSHNKPTPEPMVLDDLEPFEEILQELGRLDTLPLLPNEILEEIDELSEAYIVDDETGQQCPDSLEFSGDIDQLDEPYLVDDQTMQLLSGVPENLQASSELNSPFIVDDENEQMGTDLFDFIVDITQLNELLLVDETNKVGPDVRDISAAS